MKYVVSDLHLDSRYWSKQRGFSTPEEMNDFIIKKLKEKIKEGDKLYILGDVAHSKKSLFLLKEIKCKKCLIKGNHDLLKLKDYVEVFYDIRSCMVIDDVIYTHIPIEIGQFSRFSKNIHGHIHRVQDLPKDPRYKGITFDLDTDFIHLI